MKDKFLFYSLIGLFLIVTLVATSSSLKQKVKAVFNKEERVVLASIEGAITKVNTAQKVLKIKDHNNLIIEIYDENQSPSLLVTQAILTQKVDGYMSLNNQMTKLSILDLDNDGLSEIIVPHFDANNQARVIIFKFNPNTQALENITQKIDLQILK